jgi:hypothetical protein
MNSVVRATIGRMQQLNFLAVDLYTWQYNDNVDARFNDQNFTDS